MRSPAGLIFAAAVLAASGAVASVSPVTALLRAQAEARASDRRARALETRARAATDRAAKARNAQAAAVARIAAAEAGISAAEARIRIVDAARREQRVRLAVEERPAATLIAGLQTLARRPPALSLIQRGSLDDLVHTRALLASTMPVIAARTRGLRAELAAADRIERDAAAAAASLRAGRAELQTQRASLARLEAAALLEGRTFNESALDEGDRALALGEDVRAIVSGGRQRRTNSEVAAILSRLGAPIPRPGPAAPPRPAPQRPAYLLPVAGRLVIGTGEISDAGVHARGLTLVTASQAPVVAPAAGRVVYAGPFRSYGGVVIIDHGAGWTTTVTNLATLDTQVGENIDRGDALGTAPQSPARITVELRRGTRAVAITPLL